VPPENFVQSSPSLGLSSPPGSEQEIACPHCGERRSGQLNIELACGEIGIQVDAEEHVGADNVIDADLANAIKGLSVAIA
jgi:hypothetical protein